MRLVFLVAILFSIKASAFDVPLNSIRLLYQKAAENKDACKKLVTILEPYSESNNTLLSGYKACATMLMAKYVFNPVTKLFNFYKGKNLLERTIKADNENIELRFLRFAVQTEVPYFLGYRSSLPQDKAFLISNYNKITDPQLKRWMMTYLNMAGNLTALEKQRLKA